VSCDLELLDSLVSGGQQLYTLCLSVTSHIVRFISGNALNVVTQPNLEILGRVCIKLYIRTYLMTKVLMRSLSCVDWKKGSGEEWGVIDLVTG